LINIYYCICFVLISCLNYAQLVPVIDNKGHEEAR